MSASVNRELRNANDDVNSDCNDVANLDLPSFSGHRRRLL